jgi:glycosyltransferase involved in cell wall biosynthesis
MIDKAVTADSPVPVIPANEDTVRRAADHADIVLFWGVPMGELLQDHRPKLCVYVAHSDNDWTRDVLHDSSPFVDHVIAVSRRVQTNVCRGFASTVILNGVDASRLSQTRSRSDMRRSLGFESDDFVLGFLGRMSWEKRPERLIDAVEQLPPNFKALFVGWGPLRPQLLEAANTRIPGRYAFASADRNLGDYYQALDAFCLLSEQEGFALVLLEAMLTERPIITTDVGFVSELVEDRINAVVVDGSPQSICDAALRLQQYPAWANGLAAEGRALADQHGHAWRMARDYERFFWRLWSEKFAAI